MATGTFFLKPSEDISVEHTLYPSSSTAAYLLIDDEVDDSSSTCIQDGAVLDGSVSRKTSSFLLSVDTDVKIISVISATFQQFFMASGGEEDDNSVKYTVLDKDGNEIYSYSGHESNYNGEQTFIGDVNAPNIATAINDHIAQNGIGSLPELVLSIYTELDEGGGKTNCSIFVSQAIFVLECEYATDIGVRKKVNGNYTAATAAYQKIGGSWSEITEEDCKNILRNNTIRSG